LGGASRPKSATPVRQPAARQVTFDFPPAASRAGRAASIRPKILEDDPPSLPDCNTTGPYPSYASLASSLSSTSSVTSFRGIDVKWPDLLSFPHDGKNPVDLTMKKSKSLGELERAAFEDD
jgi:hypothetical protein